MREAPCFFIFLTNGRERKKRGGGCVESIGMWEVVTQRRDRLYDWDKLHVI